MTVMELEHLIIVAGIISTLCLNYCVFSNLIS